MVSRFLRPLTQELIPEFEKFFRTGNPDNWFMLYVCTFILLEEVSFSCQDRRRHAKENWLTDVCCLIPCLTEALTPYVLIPISLILGKVHTFRVCW